MSNEPSPGRTATASSDESQHAEQARRQISQLTEDIAQISESDISPAQYFSEFLQRVYLATQAFAAAIWVRTPQGNLQLQCQINLRELGLDRTPDSKPMHDELLRQAILQAKTKGGVIRPHFSHNLEGADQVAGNPTDHTILLAPILQEKVIVGLVEIWLDPSHDANALQNVHHFLVRMAAFISLFNRNHQLRQMLGQQELWVKLENFARQIHGSMHMTEVAYLVANEGRRLIDVDRISVATRPGDKCEVTAISGADVVEKRSNLVVLMRKLFDAVIDWGEKLVYVGTKDDALPPKVLEALDLYLGESNSKVLVIMPLPDEREKERQRKARSALMMECFETNLQPEQLIARLDVVGRHACSALYNAQEYRRIPMRFLWLPLAYLQDGLGGKSKAITSGVLGGLTILILAMIFVPFPLKMEANGQLLPKERVWIYPTLPGKVEEIAPGLKSGSRVSKGQILFTLSDSDLAKQVSELQTEISILENKVNLPVQKPGEGSDKGTDVVAIQEAKTTLRNKIEVLRRLQQRTNANLAKPGYFTITAPRAGIILTAELRELLGRIVKPSDALIHIGFIDPNQAKLSEWEIVLKIPHKHYGQVIRAYDRTDAKELRVDVLSTADATQSFQARLAKDKIARQANAQKDDNTEPEPVVLAWGRINGDDIPAAAQITPSLLLSGGEVHTRIRCGNRPMGYSLFYGVWEFVYEKVIFPFGWR